MDLAEIETKMKNISGVRDAVVISMPVPQGRENDVCALAVSSIFLHAEISGAVISAVPLGLRIFSIDAILPFF